MKVYYYSKTTTSLIEFILKLELSQIEEVLLVYSEVLLFFAKYSFLFEKVFSKIPSLPSPHTPFEDMFITPDPARDGENWWSYCNSNPVTYTDPDGLNTLDDFYYQKVTNAETKEDKENYLQQQTQLWKGNQGLSEYGKIVETFQEFAESNFNQENPLEQNELDKLLGYNKKLGISTSCMLAAIINAYASLFKNGITGLQIINSLFDGDDNIFKYIGVDKNKRGLLSQRTDPAGTVIKSVYDGNGNVTKEIRSRGNKTETKTYEYDEVGFMNKAVDNGVTSLINYRENEYNANAWGLVTEYQTVIK